MTKSLRNALLAGVALMLFAPHANAHMKIYVRDVNWWMLGTYLDHTYESCDACETWYNTFDGGTTGGYVWYTDSSSPTWWDNVCWQRDEWDPVYGPLYYLSMGVCHQGSNRALQNSYIPYTYNLGVDGSSASKWYFGNLGLYCPSVHDACVVRDSPC